MSGRAIKRSDESAGGGSKMMSATGSGPKIAVTGGKAQNGPADSKHSISDAARAQQPTAGSSATKLVFGLNPRAHRPKRQEASEQTLPVESKPQQQQQSNGLAVSSGQSDSGSSPARGQIRTSKYGNFYKPQDLIECSTSATSATKNQQQAGKGQATSGAITTTMTKSVEESKKAPASQARKLAESTTSQPKQQPQRQQRSATASAQKATVRARSRSPDEPSGAQMGRRKSFDEDISTTKTETTAAQLARQQQQQQPILKTRTQFNILPPPQLSIATKGTGSVVDYAKSRIYDKPVKRILANPPPPPTVLDDQPGQVPASILSGFKPPKQVMVSKAREQWEGGEPFAKCKSRKRLAAQANKKLFPGTWSMTSVVATQQLHLQQALAQFNSTGSSSSSSSGFNRNSNYLQSDPSVKVLTRGSVLERIQQYEKAPGSGAALSSSSSCDSFFDEEDDRQISLALSRSSSASSRLSLGSDGGGEPATDDATTTTTKQAQYKSRVSSIQHQQQQQQQSIVDSAPSSAVPTSPTNLHLQQQQRRPSLRRRSSIGLLGRRISSQSLIPKFYHPNGKPNTYEIEIQKRNIVACFEKLPERRAQLTTSENANTTATTTGKRQFHQIALACGYSEYFKVPLQLYARHKLVSNPRLASLGQTAASASLTRQRKSSTIALNTNGTVPARPLIKSASIDSATRAKNLPGEAPSGDSEKSKPNEPEISSITCDQFLTCWRELLSVAYDNAAQFVHLLTFGQRNYLQPEDFVPLVQSIIDDHPGLKFLRAAPDFHMRYIQTVIARIYYNINRSWTGKLSLQELRKSNLLAVIQVLSQEEDINQITDYFSYEHFYVIYCKFWSLDQDHDLFISKEDLARHNDAAISSRIIERIFAGIVSKQIQKTGKMGYSDFVWFLIAEEDKKHPRSIEYWFRLMDLDGDGYISMYEMEYFYYEQMKRLELMNIEALPFLDSACQILDLVNPREKNKILLADLKRTRMATIFFDTFINLEKYLEHESREFVSTRDIVQNGVVVSDWDRYASEEYENLVTEETTV